MTGTGSQPLAEIVCLGNELLIGVTINTNGAYLGSQLTQLGYEVRRITCIRDDLTLGVEFFQEVFSRHPDVIIVTGGLGPTYDDIQLEVISKATGIPLVENSEALNQIQHYYSRRNLPLSPERRKMAYLPRTARVLSNGVGGAPGCHLIFNDMDIFCLPGVPTEMKDIFVHHIVPYLSDKVDIQIYETKFLVLNCMESQIAPYINQVKQDYPNLYIKSHPAYKDKKGIVIHISGVGDASNDHVKDASSKLQDLFSRHVHDLVIKPFEE